MGTGTKGLAAILGIGTALPPHRIEQETAAARLEQALAGQPDKVRWMRRLFRQSAVHSRYTCEASFLGQASECRYWPGTPEQDVPTTAERGAVYREHALALAVEAANKALEAASVSRKEITHVVAVSCTGLYIPGLDSELIQALELDRSVQRFPLYFVGCSAGLRAIGLASQLAVQGGGSAHVLVVCVELCSLHVRPSGGRQELVAAAMFGDGASACIIGVPGKGVCGRGGMFVLGSNRSVLLPEGAEDMAWHIGNTGYELSLSPRVPELLERYLPAELERLAEPDPVAAAADRIEPRLGLWAVHPGGRAIVDAVQHLYGLSNEQLRASRSILSRYGNMSSATILFVLDELHRELESEPSRWGDGNSKMGLALAFGPGLTVELQRFEYMPKHTVDMEAQGQIGCSEVRP